MDLFTVATFSAAHALDAFGANHPCARLHGHTWKVTVYVNVRTSLSVDLTALQADVGNIAAELDHRNLNDLLKDPSCEGVALHFAAVLGGLGYAPSEIRVDESLGTGVRWVSG